MANVGNVNVRITADTSDMEDGLKSAQKSMKDFGDDADSNFSGVKIAMTALTAAAVAAAGIITKSSIEIAMTFESSVQQINRVMGTSSSQFIEWANTQAGAFNISRVDAVKYGAVYGNLITSITKDSAQAAQYTQDLLKASAVVASGTGRTIVDTMDRIRSGLLGNTEAIEDLGINVNIAMIESTDAFKRFANGKSWGQLSFQTQQQIRYFAIMEQATSKFGTSINKNTSSSISQFISILQNAKLNLGQAFLPLVNVVVPILITFANFLVYVTGVFAAFMKAVFGVQVAEIKVAQSASTAAESTEDLGKSTKKAGKDAKKSVAGFDEVNQLVKDLANNTNDAAGAMGGIKGGTDAPVLDIGTTDMTGVTDMKKSLEPITKAFEELVQALQPLKESIGQGFIDFYNIVLVPIASWTMGVGLPDFINAITVGLQNIDFSKTNAALKGLFEAITPFAINVGSGLLWFFSNVLVPLGTWTANNVVPAFLNLLKSSIEILNGVIIALKPLGIWLWDSFLQPLAAWTGGAVAVLLDGITSSLSTVSGWITNNQQLVKNMTLTILAFFLAWKGIEILAFIQMSGGLIAALTSIMAAVKALTVAKLIDKAETILLTALYAKDLVVALASATWKLALTTAAWIANTVALVASKVAMFASAIAMGVMTAAQWALNVAMDANPIGIVIVAIAALVAALVWLYFNNEDFRKGVDESWRVLKELAVVVWGKILEWITAVNNFIRNDLAPAFLYLKNKIVDGFNAIKTFLEPIIKDIKLIFSGIVDFINGAFSGDWKAAWQGIKDIFSGIMGGIGDTIKIVVNGVIKAINFMIGQLNKISIKIPEMKIPGTDKVIGGGSVGFNVATISEFAKGGIISSPTLAMMGEGGKKEAVIPLENTSFVDTIASALGTAVMNAMQFASPSSNNQSSGDIVVNIDGTQMARIMLPNLQQEQFRLGNRAILQGV